MVVYLVHPSQHHYELSDEHQAHHMGATTWYMDTEILPWTSQNTFELDQLCLHFTNLFSWSLHFWQQCPAPLTIHNSQNYWFSCYQSCNVVRWHLSVVLSVFSPESWQFSWLQRENPTNQRDLSNLINEYNWLFKFQ